MTLNSKALNRLFVLIAGEKVYKIYEYNGLHYKIVRFEPECTWAERKEGKWCPEFIIHKVNKSEYMHILRLMEQISYKPYLNFYNDRIIRYLNSCYFPYGETGKDGFNINKMIQRSRKEQHYTESFQGEQT